MTLNHHILSMYCIRCEREFEVDDYFEGCPNCLIEGKPASLSFRYDLSVIKGVSDLTRYLLPYYDSMYLGEANTPHIHLKSLSKELEVELWVKNEGQNPTGSHKDRMSAYILKRALEQRYSTVGVASSGNAGVSIATYAAFAGLDCHVLTTEQMNPIWRQAIEKTGALLTIKETTMDRWKHLKEMVDEWFPATNFLNTPVGSNPFGVQGLKAIAFEIIEEFDYLPQHVILPTSRGDILWGVWEGFKQAQEARIIIDIPKLHVVEPFSRLERAINEGNYTTSFHGNSECTPSVGGTTVTYQSVKAIKESSGHVHVIPPEKAEFYQNKLSNHGIYAERSSSLVLGALSQAKKNNTILKGDSVCLLITSNGYKELLI
ncbi:threonine synthase [Alkalibacillus almallahensis]|uniref:threonine synthase n=1 Tax=Alkalibacillus almallahensis TaxID=1379154 RepID=UPI00141E6369|nr:pyridoxal-phosphate dependent enzyme [Alkalibacillus almallahensis]NIK13417.1 threonine synthase [Alkalibacillus almallahensis]